jgi:hypothetical protein
LSTQAFADAEDAGVFDKWLGQTAPECVPVSAIKSVSTVTDLTAEQFEFVRALYVALPRFRKPFLRAAMRSWRVQATPMAKLAGGFSPPSSSRAC